MNPLLGSLLFFGLGGSAAMAAGPDAVLVPTLAVGAKPEQRAVRLDSDPERDTLTLLTLAGDFRTLIPKSVEALAAGEPVPVTALDSGSLVMGLADADRFVRDHCQRLLEQQGAAAGRALALGLETRLPDVVERCLEVVAHSHPVDLDRPARVLMLTHTQERVRMRALEAYAAYRPEDLDDRCEELLGFDLSPLVRHAAAGLLGRSEDPRAVERLVRHLDPLEERAVQLVLFQALRRQTGLRFGRDIEAWQGWWQNHGAEYLRRREAEREASKEQDISR